MIYNNIEIVSKAKKHTPLQRGQLYMHDEGEVYILASLDGDSYGLICLNDGNFWTEPEVCMEDVFRSAERNFRSGQSEFELITSPITLTPGSVE